MFHKYLKVIFSTILLKLSDKRYSPFDAFLGSEMKKFFISLALRRHEHNNNIKKCKKNEAVPNSYGYGFGLSQEQSKLSVPGLRTRHRIVAMGLTPQSTSYPDINLLSQSASLDTPLRTEPRFGLWLGTRTICLRL